MRRTFLTAGGLAFEFDQKRAVEKGRTPHRSFCANPNPLPVEAATHSIRSSPVWIGPARSIRARITSDLGTLLRRAHCASRSARFLSSLTVIVGMVIPIYYHDGGDRTWVQRQPWRQGFAIPVLPEGRSSAPRAMACKSVS